MAKRIFAAGIIGGLIAFLWSCVSWAILPWHETTYRGFLDQEVVSRVLAESAPEPGVYALPYPAPIPAGTSIDQARAMQAAFRERFKTGPIIFAAVQPRGVSSVATRWIVALATPMMAALLFAWMLSQTSGLSYWRRVWFIVVAAVSAGVLIQLPYWNWWGFPAGYTLQAVADLAEGWFLAGLVIAALVKPHLVSPATSPVAKG